jgi:hypothetical protein
MSTDKNRRPPANHKRLTGHRVSVENAADGAAIIQRNSKVQAQLTRAPAREATLLFLAIFHYLTGHAQDRAEFHYTTKKGKRHTHGRAKRGNSSTR